MNKTQKLYYDKNIQTYKLINYLNATILFVGIMTLYYTFKGLSFLEISLLQSIGSIIIILFEIPLGWLSDRYGHSFVLKISALCRVLSVIFLIVFDNFYLLIISEFFSSLASAAQSGADTALFYDSLVATAQQENYAKIQAKIKGHQSLIRIASRLIAPLAFSIFPDLPFILSLLLYILIFVLTTQYTNPHIRNDLKVTNQSTDKKVRLLHTITKYKSFILYSLLSAFTLVAMSNYSQYISPFLMERGLDVKWLGLVLTSASIGSYLGARLIKYLKKYANNKVLILLSLLLFGFVFLGGARKTIAGGVIGYFGINLVYCPFTILLGETINKIIDAKYRATLLSISSQFNELFAILIDPVIGLSIDMLGFNST